MFGRTKTPAEVAADPVTDESGSDLKNGKGRPTPKRREAEQANRRPLIGSSAVVKASQDLAKAGTKEERKAAKAARREAMAAARVRSRQALVSGDEAGLPPRDKGPVRRYARDYIDSRRWVGEYVLPVALAILVAGMVAPELRLITSAVLYLLIIGVLFDCGRARARLKRELIAKFGEDRVTKSDANYGMMRSLQMRRLRLPKPQVQRGQRPS